MGLINENGTLAYKSEIQTGTSQAGNAWQKQQVVIKCKGNSTDYFVALSAFGDKVNDCSRVQVGMPIKVAFFINAKEYKGKWYNDLSLFSIEADGNAVAAPVAPAPAPVEDNPAEDLPF